MGYLGKLAGDAYEGTAGVADHLAGSTDEAVGRTFDDEDGGGVVDGTKSWLDHSAGSTDEAVGRQFDDEGGGGVFDFGTYKSAADDLAGSTDEAVGRTFDDEKGGGVLDGTDSFVRGSVDEVLDNRNASLQEGVQGAMVEAYKLSSGDEDATDETVAKQFQSAATSASSGIGQAIEGTPLDNKATDAVAWGADALVAEPAKATFRGLTGVSIDEGTTEGEVGAVDAFDIGLTVGTAGVGKAGLTAARGASKSDEAAGLASRFLGGSDEAASASDEGLSAVDDAASESGGVTRESQDVFNFSSGADEGASAADDAASASDEVDEVLDLTRTGDEGDGAFSFVDEGASTSDDAASAADDAASESTALDTFNISSTSDEGASAADDALSASDEASALPGGNLPATTDEASGFRRYLDDGASASDDAASASDDGARTVESTVTDAGRTADDSGGFASRLSDDTARASDDVARTSDDAASATDDAVGASDDAVASAVDDVAQAGDDSTLFGRVRNRLFGGSDEVAQAGEEAASESGGLVSRFFGSTTGKATVGAGLFLGGGAVATSLTGDPRDAPEEIRTASGHRLERAKDYEPTEKYPNGGRLYAVTRDFKNIGYWTLLGANGRNLIVLDEDGDTRRAKISAQQFQKMMQQQNGGNE